MVEACEPSIWSSPPTSSPELSSRELKGEMHMSQVWFFVGWDSNFFLFPFFEPKWQRFLTFIEWDVYQWNNLEFSNLSFCCTILCAVSTCIVLCPWSLCKLVSKFKAIVRPLQSDMIFLGFLTEWNLLLITQTLDYSNLPLAAIFVSLRERFYVTLVLICNFGFDIFSAGQVKTYCSSKHCIFSNQPCSLHVFWRKECISKVEFYYGIFIWRNIPKIPIFLCFLH